MKIKAFPLGVWSRVGTQAILAAMVLTAVPARVALAQPAPSAPPASSEVTPPPPPPPPEDNRVPLDKLLGRQVFVQSGNQGVEGKLIEVNDTSAVVERDGGERVTVARDQITAARKRFAQPSSTAPTPSMQNVSPGSGKMTAAGGPPGPDLPESGQGDTEVRRTVGFGTAFGGGFAAATGVSSTGASISGTSPALMLPTIELQFFTTDEYSFDFTVPVTNMAFTSAAVRGFALDMDLFFNLNAGHGRVRAIMGPGIGFAVVSGEALRGTVATFRIPAELGVEFLSKKAGFGFKILTRPWVEVGFGSAASGVGGGMLGLLAISGYGTREVLVKHGVSASSR